jgi:5,10-methylenetetrahydromethanopterin reductase
MANDRFAIRWGLAGGTALASLKEAQAAAEFASLARFDSLWISHASGVDPIVALACVASKAPDIGEFGTSVVPLYGRHPIGLAQLALTAQSAAEGRFTLGIGAGSKPQAEDKMGLSWDRPYSFTREFLDGLQPLLAGREADASGHQISTHAALEIDAPEPPILLAALGPRMLRLAGERVQGTSLGQCGPKTIATHVLPHIQAGADKAQRTDSPRVMALVRICVTDDRRGAFAHAQTVSKRYQALPSYARVIAMEGLNDPADLHLIGSWQQILDGLAEYAAAGATDLRIEASGHTEDARSQTRAALCDYLSAE